MPITPYSKRELRACYLSTEPRVVDNHKIMLESKLRRLGAASVVEISSITDKNLYPCDLLLIEATHIPEEEFGRWLVSFGKRLVKQGGIWTPALIISSASFNTLNDVMQKAVSFNWYFDVLDPEHIDSIPIRVANLLRIHDHLHEVGRYQSALAQLEGDVEILTRKLNDMNYASEEAE